MIWFKTIWKGGYARMRTLEEEITLRTEQRKRYFENPDYRKWSDCVNINHEEYGELSDCYLFHRYVMGSYFGPLTIDDFERAMNPKLNQMIDLGAVYAYFDERLNDENNALKQEITFLPLHTKKPIVDYTIQYILQQYREVALKSSYDIV